MTKPITPAEVSEKKIEVIPDEVFEAFNELIAENWNGSSSTVLNKEAVKLIKEKIKNKANLVWKDCWLDIEPCYRKAGWKVEYDSPGFNESYESTYEFRSK